MIRSESSNLLSDFSSHLNFKYFFTTLLTKMYFFSKYLGIAPVAEAAAVDPSPHKIVLNEEVKSEVEETSIKSQEDTTTTTTTVSQCLKEPKPKTTKVKRKLIMNQSLNQDASQNHKLTEYFAVRRSVRKPKTAILEEKQKYLEEVVQSGKEDGLQV